MDHIKAFVQAAQRGRGDLGRIKAILEENPDLVFGKLDNGARMTPLHWAAYVGLMDVVALMLANKAAVNAKDNSGQTPLHTATDQGHRDVAELLLANKALVNAKDNEGITPLHRAALRGHKDLAKLLLANGAESNAKNNKGQTPLQYGQLSHRPSEKEDALSYQRRHDDGLSMT